jgi:hypothetical protein
MVGGACGGDRWCIFGVGVRGVHWDGWVYYLDHKGDLSYIEWFPSCPILFAEVSAGRFVESLESWNWHSLRSSVYY